MMKTRSIQKVVPGRDTTDGAGVKLKRVVSYSLAQSFDPFLMLDAFDSRNPEDYLVGFPWHPHRGIESVTYLIEGSMAHSDSLGNHGVISAGDCQWMTAGSGIIHQEMPQSSERMLGIQLWVNLPQKSKMIKPAYRDIKSEQLITVTDQGCRVKVIAGRHKEWVGPVEGIVADPTFIDVEIPGQCQFACETNGDDTVFGYIVGGSGVFSPDSDAIESAGSAVLYDQGSEIRITASVEGLRVLLFCGKPLHEPIAWRGPIVMNTEEELDRAMMELQDGTFIKG